MTEPAALLLAAHGVRRSYRLGRRDVPVLAGVSVALGAGDFVALRGASGAGKSTLLHLLGGLDAPDAGHVTFRGETLSRLPPARLARLRNANLGFVFQAYHLLPELDALENVALPARMARRPAAEAAAEARRLLGRVGLGDRLDHRPAELSGGEQQRVAIARALVNRPPVLLADEPTGNLDSRTGEGILDLLAGLHAEAGLTLVIATHDARVAARARRVLVLEDGRLTGPA
jgi:predicted ABC-type transport system involved in lysophospholipase L1 biosynthesis ATPase subunit